MASDGASPFGVMSAGVPLQVEQVQGGRVGGGLRIRALQVKCI